MRAGKRRARPTNNTRRSRRCIDPRSLPVVGLMAAFLVTGLFFAAQQHFYVVDYGMKNSKLKKQIDELEAEKRRLMLAREIALSPAELKRTAKRLGVVSSAAQNDETVKVSAAVKDKAAPPKPVEQENGSSETNPFIVKTAAAAPSGSDLRDRKAAVKPPAERGESRPRTAK